MGNPQSYLEDLEIILCSENCSVLPRLIRYVAAPLPWQLSPFFSIPPTWGV